MNKFYMSSRVLVVVAAVVMSNVQAFNSDAVDTAVATVMANPIAQVAGSAALLNILVNGKWVVVEAVDGNEPVQNCVTALLVGGGVACATNNCPAGLVAATTVTVGGAIMNAAKGTSSAQSVKKALGSPLASRPAQMIALGAVGTAAGLAFSRYCLPATK